MAYSIASLPTNAGLNKKRKVINKKGKEKSREKFFYAKNELLSLNNEIPAEYENTIICSDSLKFLKKLPDKLYRYGFHITAFERLQGV